MKSGQTFAHIPKKGAVPWSYLIAHTSSRSGPHSIYHTPAPKLTQWGFSDQWVLRTEPASSLARSQARDGNYLPLGQKTKDRNTCEVYNDPTRPDLTTTDRSQWAPTRRSRTSRYIPGKREYLYQPKRKKKKSSYCANKVPAT